VNDHNDERNTLIDRRQTLKAIGLTASSLVVVSSFAKALAAPPAKPAAKAAVDAGQPAAAQAPADAGQPAAASNLNCKEKAPIDDASKQLRRALQYKEKSAEAGKNCKGCAQFEAAKYGDCGACKLFTGAVNPEGHCLSYAPKA
jgi:hypothetical protein